MSMLYRLSLSVVVILCLPVYGIPAQGHKLMISAPNRHAVEVGRKIAERGGNVADVAVAVGLSLAVTAPYYAALGGGGFALINMGEKTEALDFREVAPKETHREYYLKLPKGASQNGGTAVAVPGFAAGLWEIHRKHGKLKWDQLFVEPMTLAAKGFPVSGEWVAKTTTEAERFNPAGLKVFVPKNKPLKPGELHVQPGLLEALKLFRSKGPKGFYEGEVAKDLAKSVRSAGGSMTEEDLKNYKVRWLKPLVTDYEGHRVHLMPPPSSGGVVILSALKLIETLKVKSYPLLSVDEFHLMGEVQARAFRGRELLGDPDFHSNPLAFLTSEGYLNDLSKSVKIKKTAALKPLTPGDIKESTETTHFSVMDASGRAIALTVTLNGSYGSGVVSEKYGIALNNEMDDFTTRPGEPNMYGLIQGKGNEVEPGKRPLSSMSPTLIEKDGKIVMTLGAPGGPRIITGVLQAIYRVIGRNQDVDMAIQAPRVHHQFLPPVLYVDHQRFSPEVTAGLTKRGHKVEEGWMAKVYIVRKRGDGVLEAAYDSRGEGAAGGL